MLNMHTWDWQDWEGLPYLTCSLLAPWQHGFFTRQCSGRSPANLINALHPEAEVFRVHQVHGNEVLSTAQIHSHLLQTGAQANSDSSSSFPDADGLFTTASQQSAWVCTADCTPALIADRQTGQVAAVHAGWRGTAAGILPVAIAHLQAQGSQLADLVVALGPAIAGEVYQVSLAVAAQVGETILRPLTRTLESPLNPRHFPQVGEPAHRSDSPILGDFESCSPQNWGARGAKDYFCKESLKPNPFSEAEITAHPEKVVALLSELPHPPAWFDDTAPGHAKLDVRRVNLLQLVQLGIPLEQIAIAPHCTYQQQEYFFSYRREQRKQVQWSGIVSR
jgi:polyphenol oxidase